MPKKTKLNSGKKNEEYISIIYNKKNDSPKYFELKKSKLLLFFIGLPTVTLVAIILGGIGLVNTSPFHIIDNYRQNQYARDAEAKANLLIDKVQKNEDEKKDLIHKVSELQEKLASSEDANKSTSEEKDKNPGPTNCPPSSSVAGLATLSFFKPIQGQHDRTRPATLNLSGFKVSSSHDAIVLQFNIIPAVSGEAKLSGHIIVLMKNEQTIQVYPQQALTGTNSQINYTSGELFSTQRFRPVEARFLNPKKSGNSIFNVYIFARNGDLLHYQSFTLPIKP